MSFRWGLLTVPPLILSFGLLLLTQIVFLRTSFFEDMGLGQLGTSMSLLNYQTIFTDGLYLDSLWLTLWTTVVVVAGTLFMAWPIAYVLSRMNPNVAMAVLAAIVASSFVSLPIKTLGMVILFASDGPMMQGLRGLRLVSPDFSFMGSLAGVLIGYVHLSIGFMTMMLFSVMHAIPVRLEEAAAIHGAPRWRIFLRVLLPLSLPGTISASLVLFNLQMGAFVSAVILGGGKIVTFPVLIQRTLILFNDNAMAAALSAVLLLVVLVINIVVVVAAGRFNRTSEVIT